MGLFTALGAGCDAAVIIIETRFSPAWHGASGTKIMLFKNQNKK